MRRMTVLLVAVLSAFALVACGGGKGNVLNIPSDYRKAVSINGFKTLWSQTEDGSDWIGNAQFPSDDGVFTEIMRYLDGAGLSPVDNSGNFMPDFSFTTGVDAQNGYDFVFTSDNRLIMRDPNGVCWQVDIAPSQFSELKDYIAAVRLSHFPVTP